MRKIVFVYGQDFKEKSIQVLRKTPQYYVKRGYDVEIIVARDNSPAGSYTYESEINIDGATVTRIYWPFPKLRVGPLRALINKLVGWYVIVKLAMICRRKISANTGVIAYGYEMHGVLAARLALIGRRKKHLFVKRFMGTWLEKHYRERRYGKLLLNFDFLLAMKLPSDVVVMTNDGTHGDVAYKIFGESNPSKFLFLMNGVDKPASSVDTVESIDPENVHCISVSRLNDWKRVDRVIDCFGEFKQLHKKASLTIVGDGPCREILQARVKSKAMEDVMFLGAVNNSEVPELLAKSDVFFSFYSLSNLGNPLLEAVSHNLVIATLNNGGTGIIIQHKKNGFIYDEAEFSPVVAARDISLAINDGSVKQLRGALITTQNNLLTWNERLQKEVDAVEDALKAKTL